MNYVEFYMKVASELDPLEFESFLRCVEELKKRAIEENNPRLGLNAHVICYERVKSRMFSF